MKKVVGFIILIFLITFTIYLVLPSPEFPEPPSDAVQSLEEADTETPQRRAYFTNYTRQEVLDHYQDQFSISILGFKIPTYRLNYPPEEAFGIIRDQTRSTHLEEIVYPMRDSFYVNEFVAQQEKDDIWYKGIHYEQKITVRIVPSNIVYRVTLAIIAWVIFYIVVIEWFDAFGDLFRILNKMKWPFFWM